MARNHYHVLVGSEGGYLPFSNAMFTNRRHAESYAAEEARQLVDSSYDLDEEDHYHKSGSARSGLIVVDTGRSLDTIIQVTECSEEDCKESDDC